MRADTLFLGPCSLLGQLLALDNKARRLYERLYDDRLVVSSTRLVRLDTLYCTQAHVDRDAIADYVAQPRTLSVDRLHCVSDLPVVLRYRSKHFVPDGHHRLAAKIVQGMRHAKVYYWDLDALLASSKQAP